MRLLLGLFAILVSVAAQTPQDDKRLVFSTYLGGDRNDDAGAVAVDASGAIYVAGESESRDLQGNPVGGKPLTAAVFKGYLTKYTPDGRKVAWRALIGGSSNTVPHAVALDRAEQRIRRGHNRRSRPPADEASAGQADRTEHRVSDEVQS